MQRIKACPICSSHDIVAFNGREDARCANCGSLERTRYLYMLLNRMGILNPTMSVLHLAPEPGLFLQLSRLTSNYQSADFDPSQYQTWKPEVGFIDLCDVDGTVEGTFDLIIHNHVLEHVPCSVSSVLSKLRGRLNPGGSILFSVPIRLNALTTEDLDPNLTKEERHKLFGQWDHMRIFGQKDVLEVLSGRENNPVSLVDPYRYLSKMDLEDAHVPGLVAEVTGHSIFRIDA